ncbi:Nuclear receptor-interacting protein 2 [Acipenser ruthenus]|uniref:Nuclear receptor-interacting protein 2 n=1 Tax=Acipenser ruthenus TaxID=7906 RepID=A0A444UFZ2_ACIRT|nr:Nuclear receptor-interacting protein 2 [Acipenser ruthenus]
MTDSKKSEMEIRDKAILHQQRHLKQATQFTHKDSADLLPLDGLKRLGTSKDLCCDKEVKATINTGYHQNIVSQSCFRQLGLTDMQEVSSDEESGHSFPVGSTLMGRVEKLELLIGQEKVECSALVVEDETFELCLGLQTLLNLKISTCEICQKFGKPFFRVKPQQQNSQDAKGEQSKPVETVKLTRKRIKEDPVKHAEYLRRERERYIKRKEQGKIKRIRERTTREQHWQRTKWRAYQAKHRKAHKGHPSWSENTAAQPTTSTESPAETDKMIENENNGTMLLGEPQQGFIKVNYNLCCLFFIKHSVLVAYYPLTNELDKTTFCTMKSALLNLVKERQEDWDINLPPTLFHLRYEKHVNTKCSPFRLLYGRVARLPSEVPAELPVSSGSS